MAHIFVVWFVYWTSSYTVRLFHYIVKVQVFDMPSRQVFDRHSSKSVLREDFRNI